MMSQTFVAMDLGTFADSFANEWVWSVYLFFLLLGCGLIFSVVTKFIQWRILTHGYACIRGHYDKPGDTGHINHFQALCAALSATVGLGNIAGVAVAVALGGPGAVFWMWVIGVFGMALKFMECTLAVMFRDVRDVPDPSAPAPEPQDSACAESARAKALGSPARGEVRGGPMWYIQKALVDPLRSRGNPLWVMFKILAILFAVSTMLNSFGGGNMFQGWNVKDMLNKYVGVNELLSAVVMSTLVALVIIGGIKRIGNVASKLVPFMCVMYVLAAIYVVAVHAADVPRCLSLIIKHAFTPMAETGACAGVSVWIAFRWGLVRACFSNEAGEGSAAMAHAAAKTEEPIREGVVAGIGPFVDTVIICTLSALVLLMTDVWERPAVGTVSSVDDTRLVVRCDGVVPEKMEAQYLAHVHGRTFKTQEKGKLAVHVVRGVGEKHETVSAPIINVEEAGGSGEKWADIKAITLDISALEPADRDKLLVGQPVHLDIAGAAMTAFAFDQTMPGFGGYMVTLAVCLFAFSTMISWSYYGEKGAEYLLGPAAVLPYKFMFVIFVFLGMSLQKFQTVYDFSDATTGLMVLCNLPAVLILSPVVLRAAKSYFARLDRGDMPRVR